MARKEKAVSAARRLLKQLPKVTALMQEAYTSLWTDAQCDAWGRRTKATDVVAQANDWLLIASKALSADGAADVPYSRQRLAWVASLTVQLEDALAGRVTDEIAEARRARDAQLARARQVRARLMSRLVLLVGGNEARAAALAIANKGSRSVDEVHRSLVALGGLLGTWRGEGRLRLLADELGLDEGLLGLVQETADALKDAALQAGSAGRSHGDEPATNRVEGRLLRELRALQLALSAAHDEGLVVPTLKVRGPLKSLFSSRNDARAEREAKTG